MKQTAIYTADGHIIMLLSDTGLGEIASLEADIPDGYRLDSINPETKEPVLKEIPKTEEQQKLADLEAKQAEDDERYIDQEYRLTLLELGLDDTETATGQ